MTREIPDHVKTFSLTRVSRESTTYHFRPDKGIGWALATVNDMTYELAIQSDWGSWQYRWSASGMPRDATGTPSTLTAFLAERDLSGHYACDYIADKLTSRDERNVFDPSATVQAMRKHLIDRRLEQGRALIEYYEDCEPGDRVDVGADIEGHKLGYMDLVTVRPKYAYTDEQWPLTKSIARALYDAIDDECEGCNDERDFTDRFLEINGHEWITEEPWDHFEHTPSVHYYQLLYGILPALVRALQASPDADAMYCATTSTTSTTTKDK